MDQIKLRSRHRAGPWPSWLKWYREQGWWARDAQAYRLYETETLTMTQIAERLGCSVSTIHRGIRRTDQRMHGNWPPEVSNGFGLDQDQRRRLRLRQARAQYLPAPEESTRLTPTVNAFQVPDWAQDQYDENGEEAW